MKVIKVARCAVNECPYCIPDAFNKGFNWCTAFEHTTLEVSAKLKTFPYICPLEELSE